MDIIAGIAAATEALKLTKELRSIDIEVDKADLKLRIVGLVDSILDTKEALQDAKEREFTLKEEIQSLKNKLNNRGSFEDEKGCLYLLADDGDRVGEPYCNHCYVEEDKLYRLRHFPAKNGMLEHHRCDHCNKVYTI